MKIYNISAEQFANTEYRPDCTREEIEAETGWTFSDVAQNLGVSVELAADCRDLRIWVETTEDGPVYTVEEKSYIVPGGEPDDDC